MNSKLVFSLFHNPLCKLLCNRSFISFIYEYSLLVCGRRTQSSAIIWRFYQSTGHNIIQHKCIQAHTHICTFAVPKWKVLCQMTRNCKESEFVDTKNRIKTKRLPESNERRPHILVFIVAFEWFQLGGHTKNYNTKMPCTFSTICALWSLRAWHLREEETEKCWNLKIVKYVKDPLDE